MDETVERQIQEFMEELDKIKDLFRSAQWNNRNISVGRAYIGAVFSKIAYFAIPEYEVVNHSEVKIFPSLGYKKIMQNGNSEGINPREILGPLEPLNVEIIEGEFGVGVVAKFSDVILVAFRGTRFLQEGMLNDLKTDFNFVPETIYHHGKVLTFHRGFIMAARSILDDVQKAVIKFRPSKNVPVYYLGHSLGGALAAIAYSLDGLSVSKDREGIYECAYSAIDPITITYGMPKYATKECLSNISISPTSINHIFDPIPGLPPVGYASVSRNYFLARQHISHGDYFLRESRPVLILPWLLNIVMLDSAFTALRIAGLIAVYHRIERYIKILKIMAEKSPDHFPF